MFYGALDLASLLDKAIELVAFITFPTRGNYLEEFGGAP